MAEERTPRPWAEGVLPTPDQLASFLAICTHAERVAFANAFQLANGEAHACFAENHRGVNRSLAEQVAHYREEVEGLKLLLRKATTVATDG